MGVFIGRLICIDMMKTPCVYLIKNLITEDEYIGSSVKGLEWRQRRHLQLLRSKKHHNRHLQYAFDKYGESQFLFSIIEFTDIVILVEREQFWINTRQPIYNVMRDIKSHIGVKRSDETRRRISESLKGKSLSDEHKESIRRTLTGKKQSDTVKLKRAASLEKPIQQIALDGSVVEWRSATYAAKELNLRQNSIRRCLYGKRSTYRGYRWQYVE